MNFNSALEEAIQIYQPRVEELMEVDMGKIEVQKFSAIQTYKKVRSNEVCTRMGRSDVMSAIKITTNHTLKNINRPAHMDRFDNEMILYTGNINKLVDMFSSLKISWYKALVNGVAIHELGHLALKKNVGSNLLLFWSAKEQESIANYVMLQLLPQVHKKYFSSEQMDLLKESALTIASSKKINYDSRNLSKYIQDTAYEMRNELKGDSRLSNIEF